MLMGGVKLIICIFAPTMNRAIARDLLIPLIKLWKRKKKHFGS